MIRNKIINNLKIALKKIGIQDDSPHVEFPANFQMGDFASNVALKYAKQMQQPPMYLAESIVNNIPRIEEIENIEIAKPGFINFWISKTYLLKEIQHVIEQKEQYGFSDIYKGKKIMVEFTDPNPFKEFHIGHLFSNIVGEALARLHECLGAEVKRANYQGDVGMHVAKSVWGMEKMLKDKEFTIAALEQRSLQERVKFLGQAYALGATLFEKDAKIKEEVTILNKKIYEKDKEIQYLYEKGRQWSLDYFEAIYERLGMKKIKRELHFDYYFFESGVGIIGLQLVQAYLERGVFEKSQGAIIFPGKKYGLHNRVFINSLGLPTYEAKELGLAVKKYEAYPFDLSIVITGSEVNEYFKVLLAVLSTIRSDIAQKTKHISHGMIRLPEGKMSSRTGNIITGEWLLDQIKKEIQYIILGDTKGKVALERIAAKMAKKDASFNTPEREIDHIAEIIGLGAIKYALLKNSIGNDVEFDFEESVSLEGNSGPYLQYTFVRCQSVLAKEKREIITKDVSKSALSFEHEEIAILRTIAQFPEIVLTAGKTTSPTLICTYLYELAQQYNLFYQKHPILKQKNEVKQFRLSLTKAVAQVLKNGLHLLGIQTVERM